MIVPVLAAGLALAGCGSAATSATTAANSDYSKALQFTACMRSHGVTNFPDPKIGGGGDLRVQASPNGTAVNGVAVNGPAFQTAMSACRSKLPNGGKGPPLDARRRQAMLRFSQCMRAHGETNFPDPTFNGGGARLELSKSSGLDPSSPTFKAAQQACGSLIGKQVPQRAP